MTLSVMCMLLITRTRELHDFNFRFQYVVVTFTVVSVLFAYMDMIAHICQLRVTLSQLLYILSMNR